MNDRNRIINIYSKKIGNVIMVDFHRVSPLNISKRSYQHDYSKKSTIL